MQEHLLMANVSRYHAFQLMTIQDSAKLLLFLIWVSLYFTQSNIGAKNHAIVMPDAHMGATLDALVAAGFGAAGQRCSALSTVVFVGGSKTWYPSLLI